MQVPFEQLKRDARERKSIITGLQQFESKLTKLAEGPDMSREDAIAALKQLEAEAAKLHEKVHVSFSYWKHDQSQLSMYGNRFNVEKSESVQVWQDAVCTRGLHALLAGCLTYVFKLASMRRSLLRKRCRYASLWRGSSILQRAPHTLATAPPGGLRCACLGC